LDRRLDRLPVAALLGRRHLDKQPPTLGGHAEPPLELSALVPEVRDVNLGGRTPTRPPSPRGGAGLLVCATTTG